MTNEKPEDSEQKINQLSLIQQNLEMYGMQKQQFENQRLETESAIGEVEKRKESYKIIGNIMVLCDSADLKKDLEEKLETLNLRIKNLEKQEEKLKSKAAEIQKDVLEHMNKKEK
jgi:prefoldin beta subunit